MEIKVSQEPSEEIIQLLEHTIWGMEGGTRYRHCDTRKKIPLLESPYFLSIELGNRPVGTGNFCKRYFITQGKDIATFYIRYFSIFNGFRRKSKNNPSNKKGSSKIKAAMQDIFNHGAFDNPQKKALFYAYVELENERSKTMTEGFGFEAARKFSTLVFSRFRPKNNLSVQIAKDSDHAEIRKLLTLFYSKHTCYDQHPLFKTGEYFVFKENGEIVAGLQATPTHWEIKEIDGLSGKLTMLLAPITPIRKIFNPKDYRFLGCEQVFHLPGHEDKLEPLLTSACSQLKHNTAMLWADRYSDLYNTLRENVNLGLLDKLNKEVPADLIVKFASFTEAEKKPFYENPAYISAFDLS